MDKGQRWIGERLADQKTSRRRVRTLISGGLAVAAHLILILALALGIRVVRPPADAPPLEVTLTRLFDLQPKRVAKIAPPVAHRITPKAAAPRPAPAVPSPAAPPPITLPENGSIDPKIAAAEAVRGALQAFVHCAHPDSYDMSPAERDACARHNHDLRAGAPIFAVSPDDHMRHDPPVASHGMAAHIGPLSPRPGYDLGPLR